MTTLWGLLAAIALLWPDRISGQVDGVPLDRAAEVVAIAVIFPALWALQASFLRARRAHVCIILLLLWKACAAALFVPDGWCLRFEPSRPFAKDAGRAPHAWDVRADWREHDPRCSAIMTRSYTEFREFPAWFFNLPPPNDSWPGPLDRPPGATVALRVSGYLTTPEPGVLQIDAGPDVQASTSVDGLVQQGTVALRAGTHFVAIDATLTGERWSLTPRWNGADLWGRVDATLRRPSALDVAVRPWIRWPATILAAALLFFWAASAVGRYASGPALAWTVSTSSLIGLLILIDRVGAARWVVAGLAAAALLRIPPRLRNISGAMLLVGVPWMTFVTVCALSAVGRFVLYTVGQDYWMYQRFAYRIVMQGYWLEGGSELFYFQPFYRWIVGLLHVTFGDSSIGEWFWDGTCILAGALLSFQIARTAAGFKWGIVAAALTLSVFVLGTPQYLIGYGLSEISSAGLISMAALSVIGSGRRYVVAAVWAGVLATLAFYTRLNNLILCFGVALFAIPLRVTTAALIRPAGWWSRVSWRTAALVVGTIGVGLLLFAWRTFHYTGVFSVFLGTQRYVVATWQPGMPIRTNLARLVHSVLLMVTVNDPPRFDVYALPVLCGAAAAVLSLAGVPRFRELPAAGVLFFFASIAGAFVVFGWGYPGRFSMHVLPITCALFTTAIAALTSKRLRD
jgi:hypothetical protein